VPNENSPRIAELNDLARTAMGVASRLVMTPGVRDLEPAQQSRLREAVERHHTWQPGDDPYGERDFGVVILNDEPYYWKIDYYDKALNGHSPDPADPSVTTRVLTLMRADEY